MLMSERSPQTSRNITPTNFPCLFFSYLMISQQLLSPPLLPRLCQTAHTRTRVHTRQKNKTPPWHLGNLFFSFSTWREYRGATHASTMLSKTASVLCTLHFEYTKQHIPWRGE